MNISHPGSDVDIEVVVRAGGDVDDQILSYACTKIDALVTTFGSPAVTGEVRITRDDDHPARPWLAVADLRFGHHLVVAHAEEHTGGEMVDRLQDRLRRQMAKRSDVLARHRATAVAS